MQLLHRGTLHSVHWEDARSTTDSEQYISVTVDCIPIIIISVKQLLISQRVVLNT